MHDASLCGSSAGAQQSCGRHRALSDTCCQQYGHPAHTYRRGVQERLEVSNVCELPHEHATERTMHVSIAVSSDRGMCKHVVRRRAGETAGTSSSSSSIYSQPIRPSAFESSSRSQTEEDSTVPANYNRSLWRTESTGAEHIQTRTAAEAARNQVIVVR